MTSLTQRTLKRLKDSGWRAAVVERWNHHVGIRQDLFGIIDVLALGDGQALGVQTTSGKGDAAKHEAKLLASPNTKLWLKAGLKLEIWSWRKTGERNKRKFWNVRVIRVGLSRISGKLTFTILEE